MAVTKKRTTRKRSKRPGSLKIKTPLASLGLSGRKRGLGLKAKAKAFGLGVGGKFVYTEKEQIGVLLSLQEEQKQKLIQR